MREQESVVMRIDSAFDVCPVSDELLGRLYRAGASGAEEATASLTAAERAHLAAFCYTRAHLHEIGLALAAICDQGALFEAAGKAGGALYAQARNRAKATDAAPVGKKRAITLATLVPIRPWTVIEGGLAAAAVE
jgi:hypothetical protein